MAETTITQELIDAYRPTFSDLWLSTTQQSIERLGGTTLIESDLDGRAHRYQKHGTRGMSQITGRFQQSNPTESEIETRWMYGTAYDDEIKYSRRDQRRLEKLALPTSQGMAEQKKALNRLYDDVKIAALLGDSHVGEDDRAPTVTALPGGNTIAVDYQRGGGGSDSGMTLDKMLRGLKLLSDEEWDEMPYLLIGSQQVEDLYADIDEFRNNDFRSKHGTFDKSELFSTGRTNFMGIELIRTNRLPVVDGTSNRKCIMYVKPSIVFGAGSPQSFLDLMPGEKHSIQQRFEVDPVSATRLYENGVFPIIAAE